MRHLPWFQVFAALLCAAAAGCQRQAPTVGPAEPPVVPVSRPVQRAVTDFVDYTGRTAAVQMLDVRARVTGYLIRMPFKEGAEVKKGEVLFEIDPRPYQAQVDAAKAQMALNEANYRLAQAENARSKSIASRSATAISREDLEKYQAQELQAQANLGVSKANLSAAQLNLDFTKLTSPIDGQVSRYYLTLGNLVVQDQTLLTTVVSVDPMYAFFDMDERTILRIRRAINAGRIKPAKEPGDLPVFMGLEGEEGYPHRGTIDFVNNSVNVSTGTISVRADFANPRPPNGRRLLTPGMFVRIHLPIGQPHPALLVIDRAVGSDQGLKFVYVVNAQNQVEYRRVTLGPLQEDGLRVVEGIKPDDWVVVGALQMVRPRTEIRPEQITMPTLGASSDGEAPANPSQPPAGNPRS